MRISWKLLCLALLPAGALLLAGCGGVSASQSVSPLNFLLPGLIQATPPQTNAPVAARQDSVAIASAR